MTDASNIERDPSQVPVGWSSIPSRDSDGKPVVSPQEWIMLGASDPNKPGIKPDRVLHDIGGVLLTDEELERLELFTHRKRIGVKDDLTDVED